MHIPSKPTIGDINQASEVEQISVTAAETQGAAEDRKRMDNENIRWHLFDLSSDFKMLKQLFREQKVGFPTPENEIVPMRWRIETMETHLDYLATELGCDPKCPPPKPMHPLYPLGEGRMSDAEYEQRKKTGAGAATEWVEQESTGGRYFRLYEQALQQGGLEAGEAVIAMAIEDDMFRRIQNGDDDVILFHDESWFDVGLCFHLHLLNSHRHGAAVNYLSGLANETQGSQLCDSNTGEPPESK
jgi:hypothetical protein